MSWNKGNKLRVILEVCVT